MSIFLLISNTCAVAGQAEDKYVLLISIDGFGWDWYWKNPKVKIPTIRKIASEGKSNRMEVSYPSVTWASHTSMMTGKFPKDHGVIGNSIYNRKLHIKQNFIGDDVFDKDSYIKTNTVYDILKEQSAGKLVTAAISWPITRGSKNLDYIVPESYTQSTYIKETKPDDFLEKLNKEGVPVDNWGEWSTLSESYRQDHLTTEAARYLIKKEKPNLLMMHYLVTDSFSHLYGAASDESIWAHEYVDQNIKRIIDTLIEEGIYENTNIFVVSDHGWTNITKAIKPNVYLKNKGHIRIDINGEIISKDAISVMNHGVAFIYILNEHKKTKIINEFKTEFAKTEGVNAVYTESDYPSIGLPAITENAHMPDLIVDAKESYYFVDEYDGVSLIDKVKYVATHGHDPLNKWMDGVFIAKGPAINLKSELKDVTVRDITPTILKIFDINMASTNSKSEGKYRNGRLLDELLLDTLK